MPDSSEPEDHTPEDRLCVDLIRTMIVVAGLIPAYATALQDVIVSETGNAGNHNFPHDADFKRLQDFTTLMTLFLIWRTANFASQAACDEAGVVHGSTLPRATCNTLGLAAYNDVCLPNNMMKMVMPSGFIMSKRREIDAGERFGLVRRIEDIKNRKPLEATEKLHRLMMTVIKAYNATNENTDTDEDDDNETGQAGT